MRGLIESLHAFGRDCADAIAALFSGGAGQRGDAGQVGSRENLERLSREVAAVGQYVARLKREIGALRPNEIYRDRLPSAHGDLDSIREATASSANVIMSAAEEILAIEPSTLDAYRAQVEEQVMRIFEACTFQDITGQRVTRLDDMLSQIEKRLQRFALAVKASDASGGYDRESIMREARREVLIVEGPQNAALGIDQSAIDKLFD